METPIISSSKKWLTEQFEFGSCVIDHKGLSERYTALENWKYDWVQLYTITVTQGGPGGHQPPQTIGAPPASVGGIPVEAAPYGASHDEYPSSQGSAREFDEFKAKARKEKEKAAKKRAEQVRKEEIKRVKEEEKAAKEEEKKRKEEEKRLMAEEGSARKVEDAASEQSPPPAPSPTPSDTRSPSPPAKTPVVKPFKSRHFIVLPWTMGYRWQSVPIAGCDDEVAAHCGIFFPDQNLEYEKLLERVSTFVVTWCG